MMFVSFHRIEEVIKNIQNSIMYKVNEKNKIIKLNKCS